jgi:hypothetical protein
MLRKTKKIIVGLTFFIPSWQKWFDTFAKLNFYVAGLTVIYNTHLVMF